MTKEMFGGIKVRLTNLKILYQLSSMVVVVSCSWAVLVSAVPYVAQSELNNEEGGQ